MFDIFGANSRVRYVLHTIRDNQALSILIELGFFLAISDWHNKVTI